MKPFKTFDVQRIREDFPILSRQVNGKPLVYFDSSATSQKPSPVIAAINNYYKNHNANVHRGIHKLAEEATIAYEEAHQKVSRFIHGKGLEEIVFTKNTTESLNLLAYSLTKSLKKGDEIALTQMEHHSNLVPWQQLSKERGLVVKFIKIDQEGKLDPESIQETITKKTKIVSLTHVSNALGTVNPVKEIGKIAHENGALFVVDAAQSVPHMPVDVTKLECDFLAFSGHKMCGPTGIGVLYGKKELLENLPPFLYGGEMISQVTFEDTSFAELPWKFEAGTMNIAEAVGLAAAIDYLTKIGMENVHQYEKSLTSYGYKILSDIPNLTLYGPSPPERAGILSFNVSGIHPHDLSTLLDQDGIAIRAGHHCAMPLMNVLNVPGTARASLYFYNTREELDRLAESLEKAKKVFA